MKRDLPALCYRKGRKGHVYYYPHGARGKGKSKQRETE
jgi:hypothetical protein